MWNSGYFASSSQYCKYKMQPDLSTGSACSRVKISIGNGLDFRLFIKAYLTSISILSPLLLYARRIFIAYGRDRLLLIMYSSASSVICSNVIFLQLIKTWTVQKILPGIGQVLPLCFPWRLWAVDRTHAFRFFQPIFARKSFYMITWWYPKVSM